MLESDDAIFATPPSNPFGKMNAELWQEEYNRLLPGWGARMAREAANRKYPKGNNLGRRVEGVETTQERETREAEEKRQEKKKRKANVIRLAKLAQREPRFFEDAKRTIDPDEFGIGEECKPEFSLFGQQGIDNLENGLIRIFGQELDENGNAQPMSADGEEYSRNRSARMESGDEAADWNSAIR